MAETLSEFYTQQNKPLPTIQERAGIYEQQGLGGAGTYQGTAQQNVALLQRLQVPPPTSTTISADTLGTNPLQLPTKTEAETPAFPMTQAPTVDEQAQQFAQTQTPTPTPTETAQTGLMSRFKTLEEKLFGKSTAQTQQEQAQGIPQKTQAVTDIQSQINQLQNEANAAKIQAQSMGETSSFGNAQIAQIERDRTVKALQLNSFLYAAQGNLATAQMMSDKAVIAEFAPAEAEIAYIREALQMNEKIMTIEDKKKADQLQLTLNERERLLEEQKTEKKAISSIAIEASQAGADALLLNKISQAKTQDEALQIMASDPNMRAWAEAKRAKEMANTSWREKVVNGQMHNVLVNNTTGQVISDLGVSELPKAGGGTSGTPSVSDENGQRITVLDSTSSSYINDLFNSNIGGKKVTQVELLRPLQKALTVSSQLGELSTLVKTTNTDPIIGTLRSMNPYDFDARAIQATLQAIVPNLARGVYGEVGVLTDNDIKNYIQTLPNIKSTEQQNKFVMGMTLRSLQSGLLAQLEVLQAGGYDLSGFRNSYDKMARQANDIEKDLGIGKEAGAKNTSQMSNQEFLQSIPTFRPPASAQTDNKSFFGDIYNWLTGK